MRASTENTLRAAAGWFLMASAVFALSSCSTDDVVKNQQGITEAQQSVIDRREARQGARDERFRASRESVMN